MEFIGADTISGLIQHWTGLGESFTTLNDLLLRHYTRAILWGVVATIGIYVIGYFLQFALTLNTTILSTPIVQSIYSMLLNLINIGFVISLIVMAFATMFRNDKYGYKKNLPKFLAAALLINFGFFFARAVIDIGNTVTIVFADAVSGETYAANSTSTPSNFGTAASLVNNYNVASITCSINQYIDTSSSQSPNALEAIILKVLQPLMSVSFGSIITLLWAATLLAITIVFIARYAFLVLLVAVMPVSWLGWIFPGIKVPLLGGKGGTFEGWWSQFLNWVFVGPLLLFLLYISRIMTNDFVGKSAFNVSAGALVFSSQLLLQLIIILLINVIGLFAAVKMSGAAGKLVVAGVGGGLGWAAQRVTNFSGNISARAKVRQEEAEKAGRTAAAKAWNVWRGVTSGVAMPPQYAPILKTAGIKVPEQREFDVNKAIESRKQALSKFTTDEVVRMAQSRIHPKGSLESAALLNSLVDRKATSKVNSKQLGDLLVDASRIGGHKDLITARPELAGMLIKKNPDNIEDTGAYLDEVIKAATKIKLEKARDVVIPMGEIKPDGSLALREMSILGLAPQQLAQKIKSNTTAPEEQKLIIETIKALADKTGRGKKLADLYKNDPETLKKIQQRTDNIVSFITQGGKKTKNGKLVPDMDLLGIWNSY